MISDTVPCVKVGDVVELVTGSDVGPRPRAAGVAADLAAPQPCVSVEATQHGDGRTALCGVGLQQIIQRAVGAVRRADVIVLFEAGERGGVAARDPQRPIGKHLLAIG